MRIGKWNARSLYRSGSLTTLVRELVRYKFDLVGVQEVRWVGFFMSALLDAFEDSLLQLSEIKP